MAALLKKRKMGAPSRGRAGRVVALIDAGFLRELRMRDPAISLPGLSRGTRLSLARLGELERRRGKRVTLAESEAIATALYWTAPVEGVCSICGCTDEWGCDGGCSWVNAAHTLCSECVGNDE